MKPTQLTDEQARTLFGIAFGFNADDPLHEVDIDRSQAGWLAIDALYGVHDHYSLNISDNGILWAAKNVDPAEIRPRAIINYLDSL